VTREDPAFGGPVAGIAAGLAALGPGRAPRVLVLACDVPRASAAMPALLDAASGDPSSPDGAFLVRDGRAQWLVGVYARSALDTALADLARARPDGLHGASVRSLMAGLRCVEVPDPDGLSDDVDTWADATRLAAVSRAPTPPPPPRRNR
jgi:molybdopterin-guanine dinucleotide biosynthesis protein A